MDEPGGGPEVAPVCLLIHGFTSDSAVWAPLRDMAASDPNADVPELRNFDYSSRLQNLNMTKLIPSLDVIADQLRTEVQVLPAERQIIMVGHSQGGLVIQRFLDRALRDGHDDALDRIRSVVLFACPNYGSAKLGWLRKLAIRRNPQERALRPFDPEVAETHRRIVRDVVAPVSVSARSHHIDFVVFYGTEDGVVLPASARGSFPEIGALPGGHTSLIQPTSLHSINYVAFKLAVTSGISGASVVSDATANLAKTEPPSAAPVSLQNRLFARRADAEHREAEVLASLPESPSALSLRDVLQELTLQGVVSRRGFRVRLIDPSWAVYARVLPEDDGVRVRIEHRDGTRVVDFDLIWLLDEDAEDFLARLESIVDSAALRPPSFDATFWLRELSATLPMLKDRRARAVGLEDYSGAVQYCSPQWTIYDWGLGSVDNIYTISVRQFRDFGWIDHMEEKVWVEMKSFREALETGQLLMDRGLLNQPAT